MSIPMNKTRPVERPYLTVVEDGWVSKVLKAYAADPDKPFARVFTAVTSPHTFNTFDLGDTYWKDIPGEVTQLDDEVPIQALPQHLRASASSLRESV